MKRPIITLLTGLSLLTIALTVWLVSFKSKTIFENSIKSNIKINSSLQENMPELRSEINNPQGINSCFHSPRISALTAKDTTKESYGISKKISETDFKKLFVVEYLEYAVDHPEAYMQICSMFIREKYENEKIYANLPMKGEGFTMSKRQLQSLAGNRDSVIYYLNQCISRQEKVGEALKEIIILLTAYESIPDMMQILKSKKPRDNYLLTTMMLLMKNDNYDLFLKSNIYKELYASGKYKESIEFNLANQDAIAQLANSYYSWKKAMK
ncbi:MAG TPA: hypothetical protein VE978_02715 [Chitinophagales bacterium]|nr:hypothetical protein [Chitinophagales bacterium]